MSRWVALIPARAGSKSIKKKNLMPINGKPLVLHSVETALKLGRVQRVYVSTDSDEITSVCKKAGVVVIKRPIDISGDLARDEGYLYHFKDYIEMSEEGRVDNVLLLRPTCPFRKQADLINAMTCFDKSRASTMRSVARAKQSPYKMWFAGEGLDDEMSPVLSHPHVSQSFSAPRQILPEVFWQDGYLECIRYSCLTAETYPGRVIGWRNANEVCDIDHIDDVPVDSVSVEDLKRHEGVDGRRYSS